jgi:hypothetical protein
VSLHRVETFIAQTQQKPLLVNLLIVEEKMKRLLMVKWFPWLPGCWMSVMVASLFLSTGQVGSAFAFDPAPAPLPGQFTLQNGRLTAQVVTTPLRQVMEEMSRVSGAQVRWLSGQAEEKPVSVEFTALPLPEALRRILREMNFLLFYTSTGNSTKLTEVWILSGIGKSQAERTSPLASPEKVLLPIPDSTPQSAEAEDRQAEFATMPLEILIQTAVSTVDPSLRIEAIAYLGRRAAEDSTAENILSHLASNDSDPQVRAAASEVLAGIE